MLGRGAGNLFPSLCYVRQRDRRIQNVATLSPSMLKNSDLTTAWVTQHPPVHHPKNPVLGFHGWDETVPQGSVYFVSSFFCLMLSFFPRSHFFPGPFFSLAFYFGPAILEPNFFLRTPTYSPNLPTSLPPPNPSTSLPPPNPSTSPYLPHHPFVLPYPEVQNHKELDRACGACRPSCFCVLQTLKPPWWASRSALWFLKICAACKTGTTSLFFWGL